MKKIIILIFTVLLFSCKNGEDMTNKIEHIKIGNKLPEFSVVLNNGEHKGNETCKNKISVVVFFRVTCPDTQKLFPRLQKIYNQYSANVEIILISTGKVSEDEVSKYWKDNDLTMPYSVQTNQDVYHKFANFMVPRVYICNKDLTVKYLHGDNPVATYEIMSSQIENLLKK